MSDLRIAHIIEATLGGTGRHVLDILETCAARGMGDLHLIHSLQRCDATYRFRLARLSPAVRVAEIPMCRAIRPLVDLRAAFALTAYLRRHGPFDAIHLHSSKAAALGGVAGRISGMRRIVFTPNAFASSGAVGLKRLLYLNLERLCGRLAHIVVAVSPEERTYAIHQRIASPQRIRLIPNSIPLPDTTAREANRARLRARWGVAPTTRLIGSVGRLTAQKDPMLFIELVARRARRYGPADERYLVVGDGELGGQLRERIAANELDSRVVLAGFRTDIDAVLDSLDVFVLHSRYEGMPYTVLEAMGHELPVVTTRVAGVADALGEDGLVVEVGDLAGLDAAIDRLLDPLQRRSLGLANRRRLERHYSLDAMVNALLEIYRN